jgi:putative peptidoglycan lipid II flippase
MFPLPKLPLPKLFTSQTQWLEKQQTTILSAAAIITVANIASSLSGLIRQRLLIGSFFHTEESRQAFEALLVAFQVPDMMFQLIVLGALSAAFIPVFSYLKKENEQQAFKMSAIVLNILLLIFIAFGVVIFIFAEPITAFRTGHQFSADQVLIAANLTRIMLVAQLFFAVSNMMSAILQSYQRFILPSIAPILYNVGIVLGVYLFAPYLGIYSAGVGVCIGALLHMAIQVPLTMKLGFKPSLSLNTRFPGVRDLFKLMPPRVLTIGITEIQNLGLGFFATSLPALSFVVIRLAITLITIPIRLFGVPISQASLPFLASEADEKGLGRFKELLLQSMHQISFFAMPASVLILILRVPIVRLVFGTHNFPWTTTITTGRAVAIISVSIAAQAMVQLLIRAFHSLKDTRTPLIITSINVSLYLLGSAAVIFLTNWEVEGIAVVTSATAFLELILFLVFFNRKIGGFLGRSFFFPQFKMVVASFLMAVSLYLPFKILDELVFNTSRTVELIGLTITTSTIGMLVYIYFAALFNIRELRLVTRMLSSLGRWQKTLARSGELLLEPGGEDDTL